MGDQELSFGRVKFEMSDRLSNEDVKEIVKNTGLEFRGNNWTLRFFGIYVILKIMILNSITKDNSRVWENQEVMMSWKRREECFCEDTVITSVK